MKYILRSIFSKNVAIVYADKCVLEFDVWKFYVGEKVVCECNKNTITSIETIHPTEKGDPRCCENCAYYNEDRDNQPCCSCAESSNWEDEKTEKGGEHDA